jgi:hypothetical protein
MLFAMNAKVNLFPGLRFAGWTALVMAIAFLAACGMGPGPGVKSCKYRFQTLGFTGMDAQATHWQMDVAVSNPNAKEVTLTRMRYALLYQADTLLSGWNPEKRVVAPNDSQMMRTTMDIPNALWKRLPPGIWSQTDAQFQLVADAYLSTWLGDVVVPNAVKETVHINMTEQVAKYRDMIMKRFFSWPGEHLNEGGIAGPDSSAPGDPAPPRSGPSDREIPPNDHY